MTMANDKRRARASAARMKPLQHAALLACICIASAPAWAQDGAAPASAQASARYDIPAGTLDQVLNRLATSAGIWLSFDGALTAGKTSAGLSGSYSVPGALKAVLAGHGLETVPGAGGGYVVRRSVAATSTSEAAMATMTVTAPADRSGITEGSGSYRPAGASNAATRLSLTAEETPQSLSVVTRQRMDDQQLNSVLDVIDATIGVSSFRMSVGADLAQPYSRGFSISNYLIDGIPRQEGSAQYSNGERLSTAALDRVEILRGATGLTSGMGYPGASINMVRKRPTATPQSVASVEAGSWDRYGAGLDLSRPLSESGHVRARLVVDHKQQKSWIDRYQGNASMVYGIVEADLGPDTLLSLGFSHQVSNNDSPLRSGIPLYYADGSRIGLPRSYNPSPTWSYYDTTDSSIFASLSHNFSNGWKGGVEATYLRDTYDAVHPYAYGSVDRTTGLGMSMSTAHWDSKGQEYGIDAYLSGKFAAWGREHDLVTGMSSSRRRVNGASLGGWLYAWNSSYDGTINSPVWAWDGTQVDTPQFVQTGDTRTRRSLHSAFVTSRLSLSDSTKLILGGRVMSSDSVSYATEYSGSNTRTSRKDSGVVVPYAGLVQKLSDNWSAYGSYTRIFRPQSLSALDINRQPLDAEEGTAYEAGIKGALLEKKLGVSVSLFNVQQKKVSEYDATTDSYFQREGVNTKGLEMEVTGQPARGWNLSAGYAYSLTKDRDGMRIMERIPKNTIKAFTTYQLPGAWQRWTVGGGITWQSRYGWDASAANGWDYQESFTLANLMARYRVSPSTDVSINIQNAFDKRYFTALADTGVYGAPRNVTVSLKHRF